MSTRPVRSSILHQIGHLKQKQQFIQKQRISNSHKQNLDKMNLPEPSTLNSPELHVLYLQQGISAYLESVQMVCKTGSWLAESLTLLLQDTASENSALTMKHQFSKMLNMSVTLSVYTKNELAKLLMDLTIPNNNNNNHIHVMSQWKSQNSKVLEKCIGYLKNLQTAVFGEFDDMNQNNETDQEADDKNVSFFNKDEGSISKNVRLHLSSDNDKISTKIFQFERVWNHLCDREKCISSWICTKQMTNSLRRTSGLNEAEIHTLLDTTNLSDSQLKKLNQKIASALKSYEDVIRGMALPNVTVQGGFYMAPLQAKSALAHCCSTKEMEQGIQRLPVGQFLHCELPLMHFKVLDEEYISDSTRPQQNASLKTNAVTQLIRSTNHELTPGETNKLASEILGELCPARWRSHVKATLQLLFGNSGLVVVDTIENDSKSKNIASVTQKSSFIVVVVPSTWCIKEDPGTMFLLHRNVDPDKTIVNIQVRYFAVYNIKSAANQKFEPGVFVEASLRNVFAKGKENMSTSVWLQLPKILENTTKETAVIATEKAEDPNENEKDKSETDVSNLEEKSDSEEAVQDAIKLLSGSCSIKKGNVIKEQVSSEYSVSTTSEAVGEEGITYSKSVKKSNTFTNTTQANSVTLVRKTHPNRQAAPKSASFSAFDKSSRKRYQKPILLVHNSLPNQRSNQSGIHNNILHSIQQQKQSALYLQSHLSKFQYPVYHTTIQQSEVKAFHPPVMFQPHMPNTVVLQTLPRSQSPVSFYPNQNAVSNHGMNPTSNSGRQPGVFKSTSNADMSSMLQHQLQQQRLQQDNQQQQEQLINDSQRTSMPSNNAYPAYQRVNMQLDGNMLSLVNPESSTISNNMAPPTAMENYKFLQDNPSLTSHQSSSLPHPDRLISANDETHNLLSKQDHLGPIGSPVSTRRMKQNEELRSSNTWPYANRNPASYSNLNAEPEYAEYIARLSVLQKKGVTSTDQASENLSEQSEWVSSSQDLNNSGNSFNAFSTPNLVQHIMPRKSSTTSDDVMGTKTTGKSGQWPQWQMWPSGTTNNGKGWPWEATDQSTGDQYSNYSDPDYGLHNLPDTGNEHDI